MKISLLTFMATLALGYTIYLLNPQFLQFERNYYQVVPKPPKAPAAHFKNKESSCQPVAQYQYSENRHGFAANTTPSIKAQIKHHWSPFNLDIHSASKATPLIDDSGVYVGNDSGWFYKLNHSGQVLWSFYIPGSLNGIHSTAAVDEAKVYVAAYNGFLYALDKDNGDLVWATSVGDYVGASSLLADGALFISAETYHPEGLLAKIDCNSGKILWVSEWLGGHSHSSPTFDQQHGQVLVGSNSGRFFAFASDDGRTLWKTQLGGPIKGTASLKDGIAYVSSWDKHLHAIDTQKGEKLWSLFMGGRIQTSLSLVPDSSIGITNNKMGEIVGIDLKKGVILWRLIHGDTNSMSSVLITPGPNKKNPYLAWARCKNTELCTLNAESGQLLQQLSLPGTFTSVPYAYKNQIWISLDKNAGLVVLE